MKIHVQFVRDIMLVISYGGGDQAREEVKLDRKKGIIQCFVQRKKSNYRHEDAYTLLRKRGIIQCFVQRGVTHIIQAARYTDPEEEKTNKIWSKLHEKHSIESTFSFYFFLSFFFLLWWRVTSKNRGRKNRGGEQHAWDISHDLCVSVSNVEINMKFHINRLHLLYELWERQRKWVPFFFVFFFCLCLPFTSCPHEGATLP